MSMLVKTDSMIFEIKLRMLNLTDIRTDRHTDDTQIMIRKVPLKFSFGDLNYFK